MNPLPIRVDASGNPSFEELVRRARQSSLGAFANQNVPFDVLVRTCHGRRDATSTPLFQAMFLLQNVGLQTLHG
jgi:non-ribosomal peptide synthetase component F